MLWAELLICNLYKTEDGSRCINERKSIIGIERFFFILSMQQIHFCVNYRYGVWDDQIKVLR